MYYIVGLGNYGAKYAETRHNVGWLVLEAFRVAHNLPEPVSSSRFSSRISEGVVDGVPVQLVYPSTLMNNSGVAVKKLVPAEEINRLVVVYDDVDLPLGMVKVSFSRGSGGHNGLSSVIESIASPDFIRVRVGISPRSLFTGQVKRPTGERLTRYVLGPFTKSEFKRVEAVGETVKKILQTILREGYAVAMNRFNGE